MEGVDGRLLRGVLYDNLGINEGMFFENAVAQTLTACGVDLLFHSVKDARCPERTMEEFTLPRACVSRQVHCGLFKASWTKLCDHGEWLF